ncbi:MAG: glycine cleavage system protein T, partial [Acidimicrobiia bacterium]|nr:glycine cleavage system protein T [Acidimicrobiia bacterium]
HELGPGITPLQAGLGWVVAWGKGGFRGRDALEAERDRGVARLLRGIELEGRRPPRAGQSVSRDGEVVGEVTSGNFSPTLGRGIALALLSTGAGGEVGERVEVDLRGTATRGHVVKPPFAAARAAA